MIWLSAGSPHSDIASAATEFERAFGAAPDGVWAAPGRVNLIGEHVDYNEGHCMPFALAHRTYAALRRRRDDVIRVVSDQIADVTFSGSLSDVSPGTPSGWPAYPLGVAWALAQSGCLVGGFDLLVSSRVPLGAGLSSSAAIEGAVALGLVDLFDLSSTRAELARLCVRAENEIALAPTGGMDQSASLLAAARNAMLLDCRDFSFTQIPFDPSLAGAEILVIDTRAHHALTDGQYGNRRDECAEAVAQLGVPSLRGFADQWSSDGVDLTRDVVDEALAALDSQPLRRRVRHIVTEIGRVHRIADLLQSGPLGPMLDQAGVILNESHVSMRDDYEISCAELDLAVSAATAAGAYGARMTGGGFGGSAIALVPADARNQVASSVHAAFAEKGFTEPAFAIATPSAPAERVG